MEFVSWVVDFKNEDLILKFINKIFNWVKIDVVILY